MGWRKVERGGRRREEVEMAKEVKLLSALLITNSKKTKTKKKK